MVIERFEAYPAATKAVFTCSSCQRPKRSRVFRVECTVSPFNRNERGELLGPAEVRQQSVTEANLQKERFLREPLCASCEDSLTFAEHIALRKRRSGEAN